MRVLVRKFRVTGSTVFSEAELAKIAAPFENREISTSELEELRRRLTLEYVNRGYINSGAVIPDQRIAEGVIEIRIIEGRLSRIEVEGNEHFRKEYFSDRIARRAGPPLNVQELERELQMRLRDPLLASINAQLVPGERPGEAVVVRSAKRAAAVGSRGQPVRLAPHPTRMTQRTMLVNGKTLKVTDQLFWAGYTGAVYLPSTVAPCGLTPAGLPVGVQIVGPQHGDLMCLRFARLLERDDFAASHGDLALRAMPRVVTPHGQARDEYDTYTDLAERLGVREEFTEGRTSREWMRVAYERWRALLARRDLEVPGFDEFWARGRIDMPARVEDETHLGEFREDPEANALRTMYRYHLDRVTSQTYEGTSVHYRVFYYSRASKALDDSLDWLKQRARSEDVVATSMPHWAYLRKGLKAVRPPLDASPEETQALLDSVPVSFIVLSPENDSRLTDAILPFVESNPQDWKSIYVDRDQLVRIYERVRPRP